MKKPARRRALRIANVRFDPVETNTVERELLWTALLRRSHLAGLLPRAGEPFGAHVDRVRDQLMADGIYLELLATRITPCGHMWSPAMVPGIATFLGSVYEPLDKLVLRLLLARVVNELMDCGAVARWGTAPRRPDRKD